MRPNAREVRMVEQRARVWDFETKIQIRLAQLFMINLYITYRRVFLPVPPPLYRLAFVQTLYPADIIVGWCESHVCVICIYAFIYIYIYINGRVYNQRREQVRARETASARRPCIGNCTHGVSTRHGRTRRDEISSDSPSGIPASSFEFGRSTGEPEMTPDP